MSGDGPARPSPSDADPASSPAVSRAFGYLFTGSGSLYLGLIAIFLIGCILSPDFLILKNQRDVLRQVSENGILAVGMTLVILTAGIDLSVGRLLGFGSVLAAMLLVDRRWTAATWFALPTAIVVGGILTALLARALLGKEKRGGYAAWATVAGFAVGAGLLAAWTIPQVGSGLSILTVLVVVPLSGLLMGGLSGTIIAKCRLQPFIVTLAMMITAYGLAKLIASGGGKGAYIHQVYDTQVSGMDWLRRVDPAKIAEGIESWAPEVVTSVLTSKASRDVFELIPVPGLFFLVCLAIGAFVLNRFRFGRYVYAIGGNEETARLSGIHVDRVKIAVYAISGMLACLAGVFYCAQYRQGEPAAGLMKELDAIAAVVVGGTSLMGGRGRMIGTLVGVFIFGYLRNILSLCGLSTDVQDLITGIIIVVAVLLQEGFLQRLTVRWHHRWRG